MPGQLCTTLLPHQVHWPGDSDRFNASVATGQQPLRVDPCKHMLESHSCNASCEHAFGLQWFGDPQGPMQDGCADYPIRAGIQRVKVPCALSMQLPPYSRT